MGADFFAFITNPPISVLCAVKGTFLFTCPGVAPAETVPHASAAGSGTAPRQPRHRSSGMQRLFALCPRSPLSRGGGGVVRFLQLLRTLLAAHFNGPASEFHFDWISIELAVASRTGLRGHGIVSKGRTSVRLSGPCRAKNRCQN